MSKELALITKEDLYLIQGVELNKEQLQAIIQKTPEQYVKTRPGKGGGTWKYVTGGYMKKMLTLIFGANWDFIIEDEIINMEAKQVIVKGRLVCRVGPHTITKMQYGGQDIKFKTAKDENGKRVQTSEMLNLADDLKGAATDCLKKCASEIGIAADIYNAKEFEDQTIVSDEFMYDKIVSLYNELTERIEKDFPKRNENILRVIENEEVASYTKVYNWLTALKQEAK